MYMSREETIFGDDWPYSKAKSTLLRSAAVVIRERGPRSATLKNIAGKANVTEPAIFRHFDGVDGVFQSLFAVVELFYGRFVETFKDDEARGLDRLEVATARIFAMVRENPDFAYTVAKPDPIFRQYPKLASRIMELDAKLRNSVLDCLKEAKSAGQFVAGVDPEALAQAVYGSLFQVMYAWLEDTGGYDPRKEGKKTLGWLLAIVRKPGTEVKLTPKPFEKPVSKPVAKPVVKPAAKPLAKPAAKPAVKAADKPVAKPAAKPAAKPVAKPVAKAATKPAAKPAAKPVAKPVAKPKTPPKKR